MATRRCPMCNRPLSRDAQGAIEAFPFCSARCRTLDLGNWLDDRYRMTDPDDPYGIGAGRDDDGPSTEVN